ncbi:MAG: 3-isopropylmalate dehydratase [Rubrivivax sp.]
MKRHRVWRVGADIDTDQLAPGEFMKLGIADMSPHCLASVRPEFAGQVRPGDVLVAGANFGIGSSREQAAAVLVHLGIAAVIAPSFGGLFFRNAFNVGLLLLPCERAQEIDEGESIGFDARAGHVWRASGALLGCQSIPAFLIAMVEAGGLFSLLKQRHPKDAARV